MHFRIRMLVLALKLTIVISLATWFLFLAWTQASPFFALLSGVLLAMGSLEVRRALATP